MRDALEFAGGTGMQIATHYGAGARAFHWITVALLAVIIPIGLVMGDLPRGALQDTLFITHESLGLTVLGLTTLRLLWRLTHPAPPPSANLNDLERKVSGGVHALLYLILFTVPITGYLFVTFSGIAVHYFGLVEVPALADKHKPFADLFEFVHINLQWAIYALAGMHIAAALHHYFVRRNDVLQRMIPGLHRRR